MRSSRTALFATALALAGCGGADDADEPDQVVGPPPVTSAPRLSGEHALIRAGSDVRGFCAARRGELTAFAVIDPRELRLYTSTSAALEESSFSAGPALAGFEGVNDCVLVASGSGFVLGWTSATETEPSVMIQRLAADGSPLGDALPVAPNPRSRFVLELDQERVYVGRLAETDEGIELWVDTLDGTDVTSELIDVCQQASLPEIVRGNGGPDVFYSCTRETTSELTISVLRDGERQSRVLLLGDPAVRETPLAVIDRGDSWSVAWAEEAGNLPGLFTIDKESLEWIGMPFGVGSEPSDIDFWSTDVDLWSIDLVAHGDRPLMRVNVCATVDFAVDCWTHVCTTPASDLSSACVRVKTPGVSALLSNDESATLAYLELSPDSAGDLFTLPVLANGVPSVGPPSPVLGPGRLEPRGLSCYEGACTVFGREGGSRVLGSESYRYGFWTIANTSDLATPADEAVLFEAGVDVADAGIWGFDWSVASARSTSDGAKFGVFVAPGPVFEQSLPALGESPTLFREEVGGISRYRLFDAAAGTDELGERVIDELGVTERRRVAPRRLDVIDRCDGGYLALDAERGLYGYAPDVDAEFVPRGTLPPRGAAGRELVRCLGNQVFGLIYSAEGMRLYRERADGKFSEWRFGDVDADHGIPVLPPNGPVGAIAGILDDGRLVFVAHPAGGFDAQLVAIALGASDEPALFGLELPGSPLISAAALPARTFGDTLWLAWTDAATRGTTLSRWPLPPR